MSSEGCTLNSCRSSQRRAPFTSRPNPGISTSTRSATPPRNNAGAACCHSRAGTRNTVMAASKATPRNRPWRARNQAALFPVYPLASAVAMEEEYTITRPVAASRRAARSEEHTSELQSPCNLVCRLLLEKKKNDNQLTNDSQNEPKQAHHV